ncbi:4'-phosphopantetheinyl transferase family protein [Aequorivita viscosa]|uniref:4'-phosphopantetheinyl transferase superfamily protein n=1 Tax=Aequorivita viscosa TaxID=797419 RepID=A0A1M6A255_9FLAO|nr:4'-phosphopantetheinyl transferase family protein [Aequorivita viscosa]SDW10012.1 4'-phosphopantetheinyl transferase superfamily protein [Aequorivita viscosa]SHI30577.1 4'-phosphopantetheinyl transferase superfamily protein [Aequorivita viscosa]
MPLYKTITVNPSTKVLIWKIEESFDVLSKHIQLTENCTNRVVNMKSEIHRRAFMSIRQLLAIEGYTDHDLYYDENGKPHLNDDKYISITHSFNFSAIIISDMEVGIDIEKQRPKILRIAHKFTPIEEYRTIANEDALMRKLTIVWCAKESLYKSFSEKSVSFLQHIDVDEFDLDHDRTTATVTYGAKEVTYDIDFLEFEGFTCAYALISNRN